MFATRVEPALEQDFVDALSEPGRHVALHGWTGVGKTSLVEYMCERTDMAYLPAECSGTFEELMHFVLERLGAHTTSQVIEGSKQSTEGSGSVGVLGGKAAGEQSKEEHYSRYIGPLESVVVDELIRAEIPVLFIDNLEDLAKGDEERRGVCRLIKLCSARTRDLGPRAPRVIIAGPTSEVDDLLLLDGAVSRRTRQIEVPRMHAQEIEQILTRGQVKLGMTFDEDCRDQIVAHADGFPYYAHLYALHCARVAMRDGRATIASGDFEIALATIIGACSGTLREAYSRATRAPGQPALRQGTLAAVASHTAFEVALPEIQLAFLRWYPQYERPQRVQFIAKLLKELRDDFEILEDAWLDDGRRGYRFRDPLMRVYVQLRALRDEQMRRDEWRASLVTLGATQDA